MSTYVSADIESLVFEVARDVYTKERALVPSEARISMELNIATSRVRVSGSFPLVSAAISGGGIGVTASNYIGDTSAVVAAATPLAALNPAHPVAALMAAVERLEQAEKAKAATTVGLPANTGTSWSLSETDTFSFDCEMVVTQAYDTATGDFKFNVQPYTV